MNTTGAGGAGAVQVQKRLSPAPQESSIHAGCSPIFSTSAGAAGGLIYFFRKKGKQIGKDKEEVFSKSFEISPAAPATVPKNARNSLIYKDKMGAGANTFITCTAPAPPARCLHLRT